MQVSGIAVALDRAAIFLGALPRKRLMFVEENAGPNQREQVLFQKCFNESFHGKGGISQPRRCCRRLRQRLALLFHHTKTHFAVIDSEIVAVFFLSSSAIDPFSLHFQLKMTLDGGASGHFCLISFHLSHAQRDSNINLIWSRSFSSSSDTTRA